MSTIVHRSAGGLEGRTVMGTRRLMFAVAAGLAMVTAGLFLGQAPQVSAGYKCFGYKPTIWAQGGVTNGTSGRDVIVGSKGDDTINGNGGDDLICDRWGDNVIHGGSGNDKIEGTGELYGDSGNDTICAKDGVSYVDGGSGNDDIQVGGNEWLVVHGGSGNDDIEVLYAASLYGDAGNDGIYTDGQVGYLNCGSGRDSVYYSAVLDGPYQCERGPI